MKRRLLLLFLIKGGLRNDKLWKRRTVFSSCLWKNGEGVYLYDTEGNKYLDFYSGIGVNSLGYNHPRYVAALKDQLETLTHVSNYFYTVPAVEAAQKVVEATHLDKVFFCNSGAEATEGALKLARKYYYLKTGKADSEIISFHHSFHFYSSH